MASDRRWFREGLRVGVRPACSRVALPPALNMGIGCVALGLGRRGFAINAEEVCRSVLLCAHTVCLCGCGWGGWGGCGGGGGASDLANQTSPAMCLCLGHNGSALEGSAKGRPTLPLHTAIASDGADGALLVRRTVIVPCD